MGKKTNILLPFSKLYIFYFFYSIPVVQCMLHNINIIQYSEVNNTI